MSDFQQAIEWMKEGKKVRRVKWKFGYELHLYDDGYRISEKVLPNMKDKEFFEVKCGSFKIEDFEATDWEVYEEEIKLEKRSFSEAIAYVKAQFDTGVICEETYKMHIAAIMENSEC